MTAASLLRLARLKLLSSPAVIAYLAAAMILCVGGWQIQRARSGALLDAEKDTRNLARSLAQHATRSVEGADLVLGGMVYLIEHGGLDQPERLKHFLEERAKAIAQVQSIVVVDAAGIRISDSLSGPSTAADNSDRGYYRWHRDRNTSALYFDAPIKRRSNGQIGIPLSRRWNKPDGSFGGVVVTFLSPTYFERFYETIGVGEQGKISLFSTSGRILARHPFEDKDSDLDLSRTPLFQDKLVHSTSGSSRTVSPIDGRERLTSYEKLDRYPVVLVVAVSVGETLAPWQEEALIEGAVLGSAALALTLLGLGLSRHQRRVLAAERSRRESEALLREKSILLETTLASMDQGLLVVNPEGTIEICNPRALTLLDLPSEMMAARPTTETVLLHQWAVGEFDEADERTRALVRGAGFMVGPHIYERRRPNGMMLEIRTMPMERGGIVRTYTDVTARRAAETALRVSEERYRQLAETTSDVITHLRLPDFERIYASPACRALFGCEPEEMLGRRPSVSNMHPEDVADVREQAGRLARGETEHGQATYRAQHKDGRWLWIEASLNLTREETTGKPNAIVCSLRDVTERQRYADALRQAKVDAESAAHAKSDFLATMSHEIRTPLNGVIGYADLLADDSMLGDTARRYVERIRGAGAALLTVVNDILDYSKVESGQIELNALPFNLDALVDNAVSIVRGLADAKRLPIRVDVASDVPRHLVGDQDRLRQVLLNLLNNAVKFTAGGEVALAITGSPAGTDARAMRFAVSDTGIGIPDQKRSRLFQRFSQVDGSIAREFGGTGLGLAICKSLVEMMGGEIGVESIAGEGSTFWFTAMLEIEEVPVASTGTPVTHAPSVLGVRILLVEDIAINQELARVVLEKAGHHVDIAGNGVAAIAAVQARDYDLVLMDVQMPDMDGMTATREIRALDHPSSRLPIVAMTANVLPEQITRFRSAGMDDHIGKPFKQDALHAVIARWAGASAVVPAVPDQAASRVLDAILYESMRDVLGAAKMSDLLGKLADQLVACFSEAALVPNDPQHLASEAHAVVSTAGLLGFAELSGLCAELETTCIQGREIAAVLDRVRMARRRALQTIESLQMAA